MITCQVEDCSNPYLAKGMCRSHYERARYVPKSGIRGDLHQRFWKKVVRGVHEGDCWSWSGSLSPAGYAMIWGGKSVGRPIGAHRVSYEIHYGSIPENGVVMHSCDNPQCCNPRHLSVGSDQDNCDDKVAKGRHLHGVNHHCAKLDEHRVRFIRSNLTGHLSNAELGKMFGVSVSVISNVRNRRTWRHVT